MLVVVKLIRRFEVWKHPDCVQEDSEQTDGLEWSNRAGSRHTVDGSFT